MRSFARRSLQAAALSSLVVMLTPATAAEQMLEINGELLYSALPALSDYQGMLAQPLNFTATLVEQTDLAESTAALGVGQEYVNALRSIRMQIYTSAGELIYDRVFDADSDTEQAARTNELLSVFLGGDIVGGLGFTEGSVLWNVGSFSEFDYVRRGITLGFDVFGYGVGATGGAMSGLAALFDAGAEYPVMTTGAYSIPFIYFDEFQDFVTAEASFGAVQGYTTSVRYLSNDADNDGVADEVDSCPASDTRATVVFDWNDSGVTNYGFADGCTLSDKFAACNTAANCTMKLIHLLDRDGTLTIEEATTLRNASQVGYHAKRPR